MEISPPKEKIRSRNGIQVIARAAAILRTLRDAPEGLTLAEIARILDLPRSTVQRIVEALDQENLVIAASPTRGVRLGPGIISLAEVTKFEITEIARQTLENIAKIGGETAALSLYNGEKMIFIDQATSPGHELRVESPIGHSIPMQTSAPGKAVLALMGEKELARLRRRLNLEKITPNSLTEWEKLEVELVQIRKTGVAFDLDETSIGISAVAMALRVSQGDFAAISIPVPTQRFAKQQEDLSRLLLEHGNRLKEVVSGEYHR